MSDLDFGSVEQVRRLHAEENAVICASSAVDQSAWAFVTREPCNHCARLLSSLLKATQVLYFPSFRPYLDGEDRSTMGVAWFRRFCTDLQSYKVFVGLSQQIKSGDAIQSDAKLSTSAPVRLHVESPAPALNSALPAAPPAGTDAVSPESALCSIVQHAIADNPTDGKTKPHKRPLVTAAKPAQPAVVYPAASSCVKPLLRVFDLIWQPRPRDPHDECVLVIKLYASLMTHREP